MRTTPRSRAGLLVSACLIAAACGDSTAPTPSALTVDTLLAEVNGASALGGPAASMSGMTSVAVPPPSGPCPYNSSNQRFVCPVVSANGYTFNRYYQLLDAAGTPLSSFDALRVVAIRTVTDVTGTTTTPNGSISTTSHDDATLSGLRTETHTLNSSGTSTTTFTDSDHTLILNMTQTTTNLVMPNRGSANQYPKAGTIAMTITSGPPGSSSLISTITMTFNGTSVVTWTVAHSGTRQTCTLDMAQTNAMPSCQFS